MNAGNIKKFGQKKLEKSDDSDLDNLIRRLLIYDPKKRIDWNKYFSHPFFIKNEDNNNKINNKNQFDYEEQYERAITCKVVLIGESDVGKTSIISRYISNTFSSPSMSTSGANFTTRTILMEEEKRPIKFEIWDTAGQERYRSLAKVFYRNAAVCILVYDITRKSTLEEIKNFWIKEIRENSSKDISK